jgi:hypothetical protein
MEPETAQDKVIADGGFRIEVHPDKLTVVPDSHANQPGKASALRTVLVMLGCMVAGLYVLLILVPQILNRGFGILVLVASIGLSALWRYWRGRESLNCTSESVTLVRIARGKVRGTRIFPRESVKCVRFGAVAFSRYGSINGLVFDAAGKKIKTLPHVESPEAQTILREFDRFGYDVIHDIGMPMLVEMALERRKSGV